MTQKIPVLNHSHSFHKCLQKFQPHTIQVVTGPHRQNDRDDRPCREDHFFVKKHVLANMSFMSYAQVKVFTRKGRNWIQTIVHITFYWKRHIFTIRVQTVGPVPHCMFDIIATMIGQNGRAWKDSVWRRKMQHLVCLSVELWWPLRLRTPYFDMSPKKKIKGR